MPDRFSNANAENDRIDNMQDITLNRDSVDYRHGGDLDGVINHVEYLSKLGVTALWMTPVFENNMPIRTEHGYTITNHYNVDARLGGAAKYRQLGETLHKFGMKLIQDAVYNHVGSNHFTVEDAPMKNWINQWDHPTITNYKDQAQYDPYASATDKKKLTEGWYNNQMADLNQNNPYVANFLIQHAIWSVEEFGIDGWRIDTYNFNDLNFMNRCNKTLIDEYPSITMFGETLVHSTAAQAYFTRNKINVPFKSNLAGVTDYQTNLYGIVPALSQKFELNEGVNRLYNSLSQDFLYENPMNNVIFLDNHDLSRFYSMVGEDARKQKMGIGWLLTCRGIPQIYYGTEVLMKGLNAREGNVRKDFPGGWPNDEKNAFTGAGLSAEESDVLEYTRVLANYRKNSSALKTGKMTQYAPTNGVYVYFRYDSKQTVMCIMNTNDVEEMVELKDYPEHTKQFKANALNVITYDHIITAEAIRIPAMSMLILELR